MTMADSKGGFEQNTCGRREPARRAYRVVVADDNELVLDAVRQLLTPEFEVDCVVHEPFLIETVEKRKPDVVITDINMPGANGIDLGRVLIKRKLCDAVVILTVYNEPQMIQRAFESGIRGYVLKVDAGEELAAAVHEVISGNRYLSRGARAHS